MNFPGTNLSSVLVDLGNGVGHQFVDQLAQHGSVLEDILVGDTGGELGSKDGLNPLLGLGILYGIALASELRVTHQEMITLILDIFTDNNVATIVPSAA